MTNLNDTGESIPAYHIDRTLYEGRPADTSGREDKEIRTYDLLDSLQVPFVRVDHDALPTIEACREVDQLLGTEICKNLFLRNAQKTDFYLLLMPGNKKFKTAVLSKQIGSARLSFGEAEFMESFLDIKPGSVSVMGLMNDREKRVLDMCTGSGCIAISLALMGRYRHVAALDVSAEALKVAAGNRDRLLGGYEGGFELFESNMFSALETDRTFDVIVSNPPYIPSRVIEGLAPEVRDHEPRIALDGSEDGLTFYRILAEEARNHLAEGGSIYMEIGYDQSEAVEGLFRSGGYRDVRTFQDLAGQDRVVRARR